MENVTLTVIEEIKNAESIEQMLNIVTQKLQILIKKFEERRFTSLKPALEYKHDKELKEEILFIKEGLRGNWNTIANDRYRLIKEQVEEALSVAK